jgi:hypothetical protein
MDFIAIVGMSFVWLSYLAFKINIFGIIIIILNRIFDIFYCNERKYQIKEDRAG